MLKRLHGCILRLLHCGHEEDGRPLRDQGPVSKSYHLQRYYKPSMLEALLRDSVPCIETVRVSMLHT